MSNSLSGADLRVLPAVSSGSIVGSGVAVVAVGAGGMVLERMDMNNVSASARTLQEEMRTAAHKRGLHDVRDAAIW